MNTHEDVTQQLMNWRNGDASALDRLMPLVYAELRRMARRHLRRERLGNTMQSGTLVHQLYLKLARTRKPELRDR